MWYGMFNPVPVGLASVSVAPPSAPTPPVQADTGPGGRRYVHNEVTRHRYGKGGREYWLYKPDAPRPREAPLLVFLHGWSSINPAVYGAWIDHLVKQGNIVIFPRYQADLRTPTREFTDNTLHALHDAFERLQTEPAHVRPDFNRFAVVGHSVGGLLTANIAALAGRHGLPHVRAMMCVEPARTWNPIPLLSVPLADLTQIPRGTLLLTVVGDRDRLAKDIDAKRIYRETTQIAPADKNFVTLVSDSHGLPALMADHLAPIAHNISYSNGEQFQGQPSKGERSGGPNTIISAGSMAGQPSKGERNSRPWREHLRNRIRERQLQNVANRAAENGGRQKAFAAGWRANRILGRADALDYYGLWKLFDGLTDAAFYTRNREYALGNTPQQRYMGHWSDGTPVRELNVTTRP